MHPQVHEEFCRLTAPLAHVHSVLEVGAVPNETTLLCLPTLRNVEHKVGLNLSGPHDFAGFRIQRGNANQMREFESDRFDLVLCNALLEHDPKFWLSADEMKRVTRPGGALIIGTPGFSELPFESLKHRLARTPGLARLKRHPLLNAAFTATLTFQVHDHPGDYYRFSPQAYRDVLLEGLEDVEIRTIMLPPRIIGYGRKPA